MKMYCSVRCERKTGTPILLVGHPDILQVEAARAYSRDNELGFSPPETIVVELPDTFQIPEPRYPALLKADVIEVLK